MMTPAVWKVSDDSGHVFAAHLTRSQADEMADWVLKSKPILRVHVTRCDQPAELVATHEPAPAAEPMPTIDPGFERSVLATAIEARRDATRRLAEARQAAHRAREFRDARQAELAALTVAHEGEIQASGANLAEAFKTGGSVAANRVIDRSALTDAETRLATAQAAVGQLEGEQAAAESHHQTAEARVRLAVLTIKRADVDAMTERLEAVKAEFESLATAIEAARFSDVPTTPRAMHALRINEIDGTALTEAARRWHDYATRLTDDAEATFEGA